MSSVGITCIATAIATAVATATSRARVAGVLQDHSTGITLNIESCFDTRDEQEGTDTKTKVTDVNTDVDRDNEADLPDLE